MFLSLPYVKFSYNVDSNIKGVAPIYPNLFEKDFTFPLFENKTPAIKPNNVLFPEPFGPVTKT